MRLQFEASAGSGALHHAREAGSRERRTAFADEYEGGSLALPLEPPQGSQFITSERMGAGGAVLDATDVENGGAKFDLIPAQVAQFGCAQPVPEGDQDHRRIPMPMPVRFGCFDQGLDLARRQVFSGTELGVRARVGTTVRFTSVGGTNFRCDFCMENGPPGTATVRIFAHLRTAAKSGRQCRVKLSHETACGQGLDWST